jgi:hypothetical protein
MLCAASYGFNSYRPALPASLFKRSIFHSGYLFEPNLRAGEDIIFGRRLKESGVNVYISKRSLVFYDEFPGTVLDALRKQYMYEENIAAAKISSIPRTCFLFLPLLAIISSFLSIEVFFAILTIHVGVRGIFYPIYKSGFWYKDFSQLFLLPVILFFLDLAASVGWLKGGFGFSKYTVSRE